MNSPSIPAPRNVWHDLLAKDPMALVSQTPAWIDAICATGGYEDASRLYELPDGRQLVLPVVRHRKLRTPLATEASFPNGWGMGGLVAEGDIRAEDIAWVLDDLAEHLPLQIHIRPNPLTAEPWETAAAALDGKVIKIPRVAHVLDLAGGFDTIWDDKFAGKVRTAVRKAEKSGVEVECDTTGKLVPVFYELWKESVERWARQQNEPVLLARLRGQFRDPIQKFHLIAEHLGKAFQIWVARLDGEPIAAIIVLQGKNAHYTRGAMNKELANPVRANDLLHKMAIEDACRAGCRYYHMGETGASQSLARFKKSFGAEEYPYAEYRLERFPITRANQLLRGTVKRLIGFKDA